MCSPGLAVGGLQAVGGVMQAQGQYNAQKRAVERQNQIAHQQYQQQLAIAERNDQVAKDKHAGELAAHAQAMNDYQKQLEVNQLDANRASAAASQKKQQRETKAAFDMEAAIAKSIEATGTMLSTGNAGQSFLLQTEQNQRSLGFATAQLEQTLMDSDKVYNLEKQGVIYGQYNKDAAAYSNLPGMPQAAPASFIPHKPIKAAGPSKMALMGAMVGAVAGGVGSGISTQASYNEIKYGGAGAPTQGKMEWGW